MPYDVLQKLAPHDSGLSQPWATVIAACIALAAAYVAWLGVRKQVKTLAAEGIKSRESAERVAAADREAAAARAIDNDRIKLLSDTMAKSRAALMAAAAVMVYRERNLDVEEKKSEFNELWFELGLARDMLRLYGYSDSGDAVEDFMDVANQLSEGEIDTTRPVTAERMRMIGRFIAETAVHNSEKPDRS